jgi:DNA-directed RNA polymerase subunit M/transcription elongation factor TFIIS
MKIFLITYFLIGVSSNIVGPLAKRLNKTSKVTNSSKITGLLNKPKVKNEVGFLTEIILITLTILFYPIMYLLLMIDFFFVRRPKPWDNYLYYWRIGGAGAIKCLKCDFKENIISFLHGADDDWNKTGYQCQKCGKFHVIENGLNISEIRKGNCGGDLEREKPIFCPKCKTKKVTFLLKYIT